MAEHRSVDRSVVGSVVGSVDRSVDGSVDRSVDGSVDGSVDCGTTRNRFRCLVSKLTKTEADSWTNTHGQHQQTLTSFLMDGDAGVGGARGGGACGVSW